MAAPALLQAAVVGADQIIPHKPEKSLPGGWIVQKFGGTSLGKFVVRIAEDIVQPSLLNYRIAVVCSARSSHTKAEGTTNRLLRAAQEARKSNLHGARVILEQLRIAHVQACADACSAEIAAEKYTTFVNGEIENLLKVLEDPSNIDDDFVISKGEKLSARLIVAVLCSRGIDAAYVDLSDVLPFNPADKVEKELNEDFYIDVAVRLGAFINSFCTSSQTVPVVTGYFGHIPGSGLLKRIGRGYTDLCAALVAIGLRAIELQIWKEVDGIFTADPRKVLTARLLPSVSPAEAAELTFYGSEVIHPTTMEQVIRARLPIRIKNVMNPLGTGTVIKPDSLEEEINGYTTPRLDRAGRNVRPLVRFRSVSKTSLMQPLHQRPRRPTAVTIKRHIVVLNVHSDRRKSSPGFLSGIFGVFEKYNLSIDLISTSEVHVSMALHSENVFCDKHVNGASSIFSAPHGEEYIQDPALRDAIGELKQYGFVDLVPNLAIVSLVGRQLKSMFGISGKFFSTLGEHDINIEMISQGASEINISCVIDERDADRALNVVHTNLFTFLE